MTEPKKRARNLANNAVRDGKLVKQRCEQCDWPVAEKHHDDYTKPLEVRWLCVWCHAKIDTTGANNGKAILTEADIPIIRDRSIPRKELAARFGVAVGTIDAIRYGKSWRHVK